MQRCSPARLIRLKKCHTFSMRIHQWQMHSAVYAPQNAHSCFSVNSMRGFGNEIPWSLHMLTGPLDWRSPHLFPERCQFTWVTCKDAHFLPCWAPINIKTGQSEWSLSGREVRVDQIMQKGTKQDLHGRLSRRQRWCGQHSPTILSVPMAVNPLPVNYHTQACRMVLLMMHAVSYSRWEGHNIVSYGGQVSDAYIQDKCPQLEFFYGKQLQPLGIHHMALYSFGTNTCISRWRGCHFHGWKLQIKCTTQGRF